jgi:hypothetical protein
MKFVSFELSIPPHSDRHLRMELLRDAAQPLRGALRIHPHLVTGKRSTIKPRRAPPLAQMMCAKSAKTVSSPCIH